MTVAFPGLKGVLPGVGSFDPLDWGLGFELRDGKDPALDGRRGTRRGRSVISAGPAPSSGSIPALDRALVCLTDREFGPWALDAWPRFSDDVIEALLG